MKVFISYRRDDSAGHAGRVHDRLTREFGRDLLFMDVDAIPLGENFIKILREQVAKCDVLLALIGPNWLTAHDEDGNRRLSNPSDFVRIEIATALLRDIPVIPILLEGSKVPKTDQLPEDLRELSLRNGLDVRHASFHSDMDKLVLSLRTRSEQTPPPAEGGASPGADIRLGASSPLAPAGSRETAELKGRTGAEPGVRLPREQDAEPNIRTRPEAQQRAETQNPQQGGAAPWRRPALIAAAALTAGLCIGGAVIWELSKGNPEKPAVAAATPPPPGASPAPPATAQTPAAAPKPAHAPVKNSQAAVSSANNPTAPPAPSPATPPAPVTPPANELPTPSTAPEPTSSAEANPNPAAPLTPIPAGACDTGKVLLNEDFSQPNAAWGVKDRNFKIEDGSAIITPDKGRGYPRFDSGFVFGDADICMSMTPVKSKDLKESEAGLLFWTRDYDNFFLFELLTTGKYRISRMLNKDWVRDPIGWRDSDAILKGASTNKLRLTIQDQILTLGVNGTTLAKLQAQAPGVPTFVGFDSEHGSWKFNSLKVTAVK